MNNKRVFCIFIPAFFLCLLLTTLTHDVSQPLSYSHKDNSDEVLSIANWNIKKLGLPFMENKTKTTIVIDFVSQFDVVIIQEVLVNDDSIHIFCNLFKNHTCTYSQKYGSSNYKERYVFLTHNSLNATEIIFNTTFFEREPFGIYIKNYNKTILTSHIKPSLARTELALLEYHLKNYTTNTILLGDLNADCAYARSASQKYFKKWNWVLRDSVDTTVNKNTDCAYDRIITTRDIQILEFGIDTQRNMISDHYPIWVWIT